MNKTEQNKTAILLGASGLVGSSLLSILLESNTYDRVIVFARKELQVTHSKLTVHVIDFDKPETYSHLVEGDDLYCCLGTTIKQAGNQAAFRKVDYEYPVRFAEIAAANKFTQYLMVSSIGADIESSLFYLKTKGECEDAIRKTGIPYISVFRPASLSGNRKEFRLGEKISLGALKVFSFLLVGKLRKYRPVKASQVAKAMYSVACNPRAGFVIYESNDISTF